MSTNAFEQQAFVSAPRIHRAITASAEKRALIWLARHTPAKVNSDHLTALGILAQMLAGLCYALASINPNSLFLSSVFIALNWLGDSLDGTLARVRDQQRPRYGFYVDHITDAFGTILLMTGLAISGYIHWQVAAAMLISFMLVATESYLATYSLGEFHLSHGRLGPTEVRILLIIGNIALFLHPHVTLRGHEFLLFDVGGVTASIGMTGMAVVATARHVKALFRAEPLNR